MPTALSDAGRARPLRGAARKPRSGPLAEVVGEADQRDPGDAEPDAPGRASPPSATSADERQAQAAVVAARAGRRRASPRRSWRPRWRKPAASRAGGAVAQRRARAPRRASPARTASIVIRTSQPKPGGEREAGRARGGRERALAGERLAGLEARSSARTRARAARLASPKPPPWRSANAAIARSASTSSSGARSPSRSASQRRSASRRGLALGERQRLALAETRQADDASTRTLGGSCGAVARAVVGDEHLGVRERCSEARAPSLDRPFLVARGDEDGERAQPRGRVMIGNGGNDCLGRRLEPVLAGGAPARRSTSAEPAGRRVDVVDARKPGSAEGADGRVVRIGRLDPDGRARPPSSAPCRARGGTCSCRPSAAGPCGRRSRRRRARLPPPTWCSTSVLGERVPERRVARRRRAPRRAPCRGSPAFALPM